MAVDFTNLTNPFLNRNKVTEPEEFCGREEEVHYILEKISYEEPQSVSVIGERRSGKSSLLTFIYYVLHNNHKTNDKYKIKIKDPEKFVSILLDLEEITTESTEGMIWVILDELLSECNDLEQYIRFYPPGDRSYKMPKRHPQIILKNLLKDACDDGYRFLFIIDEFEILARNENIQKSKFLHYLRGISDNYKLAYLTSSRRSLSNLSLNDDPEGSPFDNNFSKPLNLGLMEGPECEDMIRDILKNRLGDAQLFRGNDIDDAMEISGFHPYYAKIVSSHLFEWYRNGRKSGEYDWEYKYKEEARDEYNRLWHALDEEQKDWVLQAYRSKKINISQMFLHPSLETLFNMGIFRKEKETFEEEDKRIRVDEYLVLFSKGFLQFIQEYVENLKKNYDDIERKIKKGFVKLDTPDIETVIEELDKLKAEWERREKESQEFQDTYLKCDRLIQIFSTLLKINESMKGLKFGFTTKDSAEAIQAEKNLNKFIRFFEENSWFEKNKKGSLDVMTGKRILDMIIDYLKDEERHQIFGNGYDKLLTLRIKYMQKHDCEEFKDDFEKLAGEAFNRLIKVHDYRRVGMMLQTKPGPIIRILSDFFYKRPLLVIGSLILVPFILLNFATAKLGIDQDIQVYLWPAVFLLVHIPLMLSMFRPMMNDKYCKLPHASKLLSKAFFYRTIVISVIGFFIFLGTNLFDTMVEHYRYTLGVWFTGIIITITILTIMIYQNVQDWKAAYLRASYFCGMEYLKAFWVIFILSAIFSRLIFPDAQIIETENGDTFSKLVENVSNPYFPINIQLFFKRLIVNIPAVLATSVWAPLAGLLTSGKAE